MAKRSVVILLWPAIPKKRIMSHTDDQDMSLWARLFVFKNYTVHGIWGRYVRCSIDRARVSTVLRIAYQPDIPRIPHAPRPLMRSSRSPAI